MSRMDRPTPVGTPMITARCSWMGSSVVGSSVGAAVGVGLGERAEEEGGRAH